MYQNVSDPILKYSKNFDACSSSIGNKVWNSPHFSLSSKIGFTQSLQSSSSNNIFNKGFSNSSDCSSILMHSKRSPIKNWRLLGTRSVSSMTTRSAERGRPMGSPCTPVQEIGKKRMQCDRRVRPGGHRDRHNSSLSGVNIIQIIRDTK